MKALRGLTVALNSNGRFKYKRPESVVDFLIVGGGVIGLSLAQRLTQVLPNKSVYLVERHSRAGEEISSRNSEVIHAGLYYPVDSLKTRLCIRGRNLAYERCEAFSIPYKKTGKLVVARKGQEGYILDLHRKAGALRWPRHSPASNKYALPSLLLSGDQARDVEPDLSPDVVSALWSPETGIVDSHTFMESLEKDILESENGELVYSTKVVRIDPYQRSNSAEGVPDIEAVEDGWVVQMVTGDGEAGDAILARTLINAAGMSSTLVLNSILPEASRIPMYYAKGSYASYNGPGIGKISHLIYPCPEIGKNAHSFQSLGTHLTLDLNGKIKFGPDIEWISAPVEASEANADFWIQEMVPDERKMAEMHEAVTRYLPSVVLEGMQPDYSGMRPKLVPPGGGFQDFVFRTDYSDQTLPKGGIEGSMISLLGIESPGLTSSLAIAEYLLEDVLEIRRRQN